MKFKYPFLILVLICFSNSCVEPGNQADPIPEKIVEPAAEDKTGYSTQVNEEDPNEKLFIPKEIIPNEIYGTWRIKSVVAQGDTLNQECDTEIPFEFTNTRNGQQSGIKLYDLKIGAGKSPCLTESANTRWAFNPHVENELIILKLRYSKEWITGSFKIVVLDANELIITSRFNTQLSFVKEAS